MVSVTMIAPCTAFVTLKPRNSSRSNTMRPLRILAIVAALTAPACADDKEKKDEGWTELLSSKTKSLDEHWTTTGNWTVKDGVATLTPRAGEKGWSRWSAYLWSKKKYGEFEIEFEYKVEKGGNSGFYFRVGDVNDPVNQGIEVQIYDSAGKAPGAKLTDHDAGGIIPGLKPHRPAAKPAGEWNKMRVTHHDDKIIVMLNDVNVNAHDLSGGGQLAKRQKTGPIGFQDHALPISLRNIRIKQLKPSG